MAAGMTDAQAHAVIVRPSRDSDVEPMLAIYVVTSATASTRG
jgi:hypothetical protein